MDAFPHFITSGLCCLYLDLGQKGLQNSLGAYFVNSDTWPLSRGRVTETTYQNLQKTLIAISEALFGPDPSTDSIDQRL